MRSTIYYAQLESPWGSLFLAGTEIGIRACQFMDGKDLPGLLSLVGKRYNDPLLQEDGLPLTAAVDALEGYFAGKPDPLPIPVELSGSTFQLQVWSALREIPLGNVATYGEIAAQIGRARGARAVGQACGSNPVVLFVPCHRVVAAQGKLGGFGGGLELKESLLRHEGISI